MSSVPPSERVAKEIDALLSVEERSEGANLASELMRLGLQRLVQEALEQEVARYLGRERYERSGAVTETAARGRGVTATRLAASGRQKDASRCNCLRCAIRPNLIGPSYGLFSRATVTPLRH